MTAKSTTGYVHGFTPEEQQRLYRQARFVEHRVHDRFVLLRGIGAGRVDHAPPGSTECDRPAQQRPLHIGDEPSVPRLDRLATQSAGEVSFCRTRSVDEHPVEAAALLDGHVLEGGAVARGDDDVGEAEA